MHRGTGAALAQEIKGQDQISEYFITGERWVALAQTGAALAPSWVGRGCRDCSPWKGSGDSLPACTHRGSWERGAAMEMGEIRTRLRAQLGAGWGLRATTSSAWGPGSTQGFGLLGHFQR